MDFQERKRKMKLLTFDVGGTEIKYAIIENAINISEKGYVPTPLDSFEHFVDVVKEIYEPYKEKVEGIAMCLPGAVDVEKGHCDKCGSMKYPHSIEVGRLLSEACGCKVILENDGKAAALAEYEYGSIKGCQNATVFVIGTAIGGGLIIDHHIVRGPTFMAGEFSFVNTDASHYEDPSQIIGSCCSTSYLLQRYQKLSGTKETIDGRKFFELLPDDENAQIALDELCNNIAIQIYNLYWLLDLEKVAIGGGISRQPVLVEKIKEKFAEVQSKAMTTRFNSTLPLEVVPCRFSNDANLIGAYITYETFNR
ncbi:MAG: ROK family protein [Erysipelotrichaceae bacterium]|nr:ROK family protein [Erysipelotrichaceae bacterium]